MPIIQETGQLRVDQDLVVTAAPAVLRAGIAGAVVEARTSEEAHRLHQRREAVKCLAIHKPRRNKIRAKLASHQRYSLIIRLLTQRRVIKREAETL